MLENNNDFNITKKSYELLNNALSLSWFFVENQEIVIERVKKEFPIFDSFDIRNIQPLFETFTKPANKNNILLAAMIFFIISDKKYPQEYWPDALKLKEKTKIFSFKDTFNSYTNALGRELVPADHKAVFNNIIKEYKRSEIMPHIRDDDRVPGWVCLFEIIFETFVEKYDKYSPKIYIKYLESYTTKKFHKREGTECILKDFNAYSVSFAGNMDKPGHADCEDYSFVKILDKSKQVILMAVCDGVGSAIDSETGSRCACEALQIVIYRWLKRLDLVKRKPTDSTRRYQTLMPMLQYDLASELYIQWQKLVMASSSYQKVKSQKPSMNQFTSTMQFALITPLFVCTGKVGDGSFYLRKREKNGNEDLDGIFELTDGRSDVLEKAVLNMAILDTNPRSLQINFYRRDEVKDILITSDGVSPIFKDDSIKAYYIMKDLYRSKYFERIEKLEKMARHGSDVNTVDYSSGGDDASVAYISFGNEEK